MAALCLRPLRYEPDKLGVAGLTAVDSLDVSPPRIAECPVQLEAVLEGTHPLAASDPLRAGRLVALEVKILRVHLDESILMAGHPNRVDPERWRPLIMSFCQFFGLGEILHPSTLAEIPEDAYRPRPSARRRDPPGDGKPPGGPEGAQQA